MTQLLLYENFSDIFCAALCRKKQLTKIVFYLKVDLGYLAMSVQYSFQVLCAPNNNVSIYLFWIKCFRCHLTSKKEPSPSEPLPRPVNKSSKFTNSNSCGNQFTYPFGMAFFKRFRSVSVSCHVSSFDDLWKYRNWFQSQKQPTLLLILLLTVQWLTYNYNYCYMGLKQTKHWI